jgi:hypothetical protein
VDGQGDVGLLAGRVADALGAGGEDDRGGDRGVMSGRSSGDPAEVGGELVAQLVPGSR